MIVMIGAVVISGPLSSPRERGPDLTPSPQSPEVGASNFYIDLWPLGGRNPLRITISCELLRLGYMPSGLSLSGPETHNLTAALSQHPMATAQITAAEALPEFTQGGNQSDPVDPRVRVRR